MHIVYLLRHRHTLYAPTATYNELHQLLVRQPQEIR